MVKRFGTVAPMMRGTRSEKIWMLRSIGDLKERSQMADRYNRLSSGWRKVWFHGSMHLHSKRCPNSSLPKQFQIQRTNHKRYGVVSQGSDLLLKVTLCTHPWWWYHMKIMRGKEEMGEWCYIYVCFSYNRWFYECWGNKCFLEALLQQYSILKSAYYLN